MTSARVRHFSQVLTLVIAVLCALGPAAAVAQGPGACDQYLPSCDGGGGGPDGNGNGGGDGIGGPGGSGGEDSAAGDAGSGSGEESSLGESLGASSGAAPPGGSSPSTGSAEGGASKDASANGGGAAQLADVLSPGATDTSEQAGGELSVAGYPVNGLVLGLLIALAVAALGRGAFVLRRRHAGAASGAGT